MSSLKQEALYEPTDITEAVARLARQIEHEPSVVHLWALASLASSLGLEVIATAAADPVEAVQEVRATCGQTRWLRHSKNTRSGTRARSGRRGWCSSAWSQGRNRLAW